MSSAMICYIIKKFEYSGIFGNLKDTNNASWLIDATWPRWQIGRGKDNEWEQLITFTLVTISIIRPGLSFKLPLVTALATK